MKPFINACTGILVGKKASVDGSTMVARDEDWYNGINPITYRVFPAKNYDGEHYVSDYNGFECDLHGQGCRFTSCAVGVKGYGRWDQQGINEYNVSMTGCQTETTNERVLAYDPLVPNGLDEECMVYLVLPFIKNAREGVKKLGTMSEKYGTGESNGMAFADKDEVWYMEMEGGHQWVAMRIPDDCYAIAPNIACIEEVDFDDPDNFMYAPGIRDFVDKYHLNPDPGHFNYRDIFGTHDEGDAYYNFPRAWYGQKMFTPSVKQDPTSSHIPFCQRPDHLMSVQDVQNFLSSHYQETKYDPMGTYSSGDERERKLFRPLALDRNQNSSVLQIRNDVPAKYAAIQWVNLGFHAFSPYVPFFANANDTPDNYKVAGKNYSPDSAYWMYKLMQVITEPRYHQFINKINTYRGQVLSYGLGQIAATDAKAASYDGNELTNFLTSSNIETANHITDMSKKIIHELINDSLQNSLFQYEKGDNL